MNGIQRKKPAEWQWYLLLDTVVKILKNKKSTIDNNIYIKVFSDVNVSYLKVSTDDDLNTTKMKWTKHFSEEASEIKVQEGSVLRYINFQFCQYHIWFSLYQNDEVND